MKTLIVIALLAATVAAPAGYTPKYRVTVWAEKRTDFSKFRTYSVMRSHPSSVPEIDKQIVAAIERELHAVGLTRAASGQGDAVATYASMTRTDVNVKAKPLAKDYRPEYAVGTLVVSLLDPGDLRPLLKLRADKPLDAAGLDVTIGTMVAEMFAQYPTRRRK